MSLTDDLGSLFNNLMGGSLGEKETHEHYDQLVAQVPHDQLGAAIGPALAKMDSNDVQQKLTESAAQMNPQQRGNIIQTLLSGLGASGNIGGILANLGINPSVQSDPQSARPEEVGRLAAHAQANDPSVFHSAMAFYADHPTLVKALGTVVMAGIARHLSNS